MILSSQAFRADFTKQRKTFELSNSYLQKYLYETNFLISI